MSNIKTITKRAARRICKTLGLLVLAIVVMSIIFSISASANENKAINAYNNGRCINCNGQMRKLGETIRNGKTTYTYECGDPYCYNLQYVDKYWLNKAMNWR